VPSVSRAATPQGRAATMTVDTPSGPCWDSPVGENGPLSPRPWIGDTRESAAAPCLSFEALGEDPAFEDGAAPPVAAREGAAPVVAPPSPPNALPLVVEFRTPGALVLFPEDPAPRVFKAGLPVPAAPLPPGSNLPGRPPPTAPAGGPPPTRPPDGPPPMAALPAPTAPTPPPRPPPAANTNPVGSTARSRATAKPFGLQTAITRSFPIDAQRELPRFQSGSTDCRRSRSRLGVRCRSCRR
jgi:hypothetical protein